MLGLRPPGFEFRILCLEGSVISIISSSSGGSARPVLPMCTQRGTKTPFIHALKCYYALRCREYMKNGSFDLNV